MALVDSRLAAEMVKYEAKIMNAAAADIAAVWSGDGMRPRFALFDRIIRTASFGD